MPLECNYILLITYITGVNFVESIHKAAKQLYEKDCQNGNGNAKKPEETNTSKRNIEDSKSNDIARKVESPQDNSVRTQADYRYTTQYSWFG